MDPETYRMIVPYNYSFYEVTKQYPNNVDRVNLKDAVPPYMDEPAFLAALDACKSLEDCMRLPPCFADELLPAKFGLRDLPVNVVVNEEICAAVVKAKLDDPDDPAAKSRLKDRMYHLTKALPEGFYPKNVLDVGCGDATITGEMKKKWPEASVVGCDPTLGETTVEGVSLVKVSLADYVKGLKVLHSFDLITVSMVMHHTCDCTGSFIELLGQLLTKDGLVVVREHDVKDDVVRELVTKDHAANGYPVPVSLLSRNKLVGGFIAAGYATIKTSNYPRDKNPMQIYTVSLARAESDRGKKSLEERAKKVKGPTGPPSLTSVSTTLPIPTQESTIVASSTTK
jgi:SAM-dependent methyltransferase